MKRSLIVVGIERYVHDWPQLTAVPESTGAIRRVFEAQGYEHALRHLSHGASSREIHEDLGEFLGEKHADDDEVVLYWAGHGQSDGGQYLVAANTPRAGLTHHNAVSAVALGDLFAKSSIRKITLILDACYSGLAADQIANEWGLALRGQVAEADDSRYLAVLTSTQAKPIGDATFTRALERVLSDGPPDGLPDAFRWTDDERYVRPDAVAKAVDTLYRQNSAWRSARTGYWAVGKVEMRFANPRCAANGIALAGSTRGVHDPRRRGRRRIVVAALVVCAAAGALLASRMGGREATIAASTTPAQTASASTNADDADVTETRAVITTVLDDFGSVEAAITGVEQSPQADDSIAPIAPATSGGPVLDFPQSTQEQPIFPLPDETTTTSAPRPRITTQTTTTTTTRPPVITPTTRQPTATTTSTTVATTTTTLPTLYQGVFTGHESAVWGVTYSADGQILASASEDGTAILWNVKTGAQLKRLEGHTGPIHTVAISTVTKRIATASDDGTIRLWTYPAGDYVRTLDTGAPRDHIFGVEFSPDGTRLVSGGADWNVRIWNVADGAQLKHRTIHGDWIRRVTFSPDGKVVASVGSGAQDNAWLWNTSTDHVTELIGHPGQVWRAAFSPNGQTVATVGDVDHDVFLWNAATGQLVRRLTGGHTENVVDVAFSPTGRYLVTGSDDGKLIIWDLTTFEVAWQKNTGINIRGVAYTPDGRYIATANAVTDHDGDVSQYSSGGRG